MEFVNAFTAAEIRPRTAMETFTLLLAPLAPHIAEELWQILGHEETLAYEPWPDLRPRALEGRGGRGAGPGQWQGAGPGGRAGRRRRIPARGRRPHRRARSPPSWRGRPSARSSSCRGSWSISWFRDGSGMSSLTRLFSRRFAPGVRWSEPVWNRSVAGRLSPPQVIQEGLAP